MGQTFGKTKATILRGKGATGKRWHKKNWDQELGMFNGGILYFLIRVYPFINFYIENTWHLRQMMDKKAAH